MPDLTHTIGYKEFVFREVNPDALWEWSDTVDGNAYQAQVWVFKYPEKETWNGEVKLRLTSGSHIIYRMTEKGNSTHVLRSLIDYIGRCQVIYKTRALELAPE